MATNSYNVVRASYESMCSQTNKQYTVSADDANRLLCKARRSRHEGILRQDIRRVLFCSDLKIAHTIFAKKLLLLFLIVNFVIKTVQVAVDPRVD